jgi:hypothetical protein
LFFEKIRLINPSPNYQKEGGRKPKSIKLEVEKGLSQLIPTKSKGSFGNTSKTYIPKNWKI